MVRLFLDTVEGVRVTLLRLLDADAVDETLVWFDLFSLEQSGGRVDISFDYLRETFLRNVGAIGGDVMM